MEKLGKVNRAIRIILATILLALIFAYTFCVVAGLLSEDHRIDIVHLGLIVAGCLSAFFLFNPKSLYDLKILEGAGFKLEFEKVKEKQGEQEDLLQVVRSILPLLLPESEVAHLTNLINEETGGYEGGKTLRREIRRLRSMKLLGMHANRYVGDMSSGSVFNLADYVFTTDIGREWARRIQQIETDTQESIEADPNAT